jgi:hypothetical protein
MIEVFNPALPGASPSTEGHIEGVNPISAPFGSNQPDPYHSKESTSRLVAFCQ